MKTTDRFVCGWGGRELERLESLERRRQSAMSGAALVLWCGAALCILAAAWWLL